MDIERDKRGGTQGSGSGTGSGGGREFNGQSNRRWPDRSDRREFSAREGKERERPFWGPGYRDRERDDRERYRGKDDTWGDRDREWDRYPYRDREGPSLPSRPHFGYNALPSRPPRRPLSPDLTTRYPPRHDGLPLRPSQRHERSLSPPGRVARPDGRPNNGDLVPRISWNTPRRASSIDPREDGLNGTRSPFSPLTARSEYEGEKRELLDSLGVSPDGPVNGAGSVGLHRTPSEQSERELGEISPDVPRGRPQLYDDPHPRGRSQSRGKSTNVHRNISLDRSPRTLQTTGDKIPNPSPASAPRLILKVKKDDESEVGLALPVTTPSIDVKEEAKPTPVGQVPIEEDKPKSIDLAPIVDPEPKPISVDGSEPTLEADSMTAVPKKGSPSSKDVIDAPVQIKLVDPSAQIPDEATLVSKPSVSPEKKTTSAPPADEESPPSEAAETGQAASEILPPTMQEPVQSIITDETTNPTPVTLDSNAGLLAVSYETVIAEPEGPAEIEKSYEPISEATKDTPEQESNLKSATKPAVLDVDERLSKSFSKSNSSDNLKATPSNAAGTNEASMPDVFITTEAVVADVTADATMADVGETAKTAMADAGDGTEIVETTLEKEATTTESVEAEKSPPTPPFLPFIMEMIKREQANPLIDDLIDEVIEINTAKQDLSSQRSEATPISADRYAIAFAEQQIRLYEQVLVNQVSESAEAEATRQRKLRALWNRYDRDWQAQRKRVEAENETLQKVAEELERASKPVIVVPEVKSGARGTRTRRGGYDPSQDALGIHDNDPAALARVLQQLRQADEADPTQRALKTEATIPDMDSPYERWKLAYEDTTSLVADPIAFYADSPVMDAPWSEREDFDFRRLFTKFPKQFGQIAAGLKGRSPGECVRHYYLVKKLWGFKEGSRPRNYSLSAANTPGPEMSRDDGSRTSRPQTPRGGTPAETVVKRGPKKRLVADLAVGDDHSEGTTSTSTFAPTGVKLRRKPGPKKKTGVETPTEESATPTERATKRKRVKSSKQVVLIDADGAGGKGVQAKDFADAQPKPVGPQLGVFLPDNYAATNKPVRSDASVNRLVNGDVLPGLQTSTIIPQSTEKSASRMGGMDLMSLLNDTPVKTIQGLPGTAAQLDVQHKSMDARSATSDATEDEATPGIGAQQAADASYFSPRH